MFGSVQRAARSRIPAFSGPSLAAGLAVTLFFNISTASAQAPDPATYDVAGIRLGMTVEETTAALKAFDAGFTVSKRYFYARGLPFNAEGVRMDQIPLSERAMAFFGTLYAIKGAAKEQCQPVTQADMALGNMPRCHDVHADDEEIVEVWFSHVLGQERVTMIQRTKTFYKEPKPAIPTLKQDVLAKYGRDVTYDTHSGSLETISWLFDGKRRLMSPAAASRKYIDNMPGVPRYIRPGDGIRLNVFFKGGAITNQIADEITVTLSDGDTLYKAVGEANAAYETLKARANGAAVDRAQGQSRTKF